MIFNFQIQDQQAVLLTSNTFVALTVGLARLNFCHERNEDVFACPITLKSTPLPPVSIP